MNTTMTRVRVAGVLAGMYCGFASATDAFDLIGAGPVSLGMGGIGAAYNTGAAGMMLNPATLMLMPEGKHVGVGLDVIVADLKVKNTDTGEDVRSNNHGRNNGPYFGPEFSFVWRNDRYALGVGSYASEGVGTQYGSSSFLSRTTTNNLDTGDDIFSRLLVLRIPFSVAYQVNDQLAVGGSLDAVWTSVNLGLLLDTSQIGNLAGQNNLSGSLVPGLLTIPDLSAGYLNSDNHRAAGGGVDSWGVGGRIGLTYQLSPQTILGMAYNFKTSTGDLTGNANLTAESASLGKIPLSGNLKLRNFDMPAHFVVGISHAITDRWDVAFDYKRVFWSDVMKDVSLQFKQSGTGDTLDVKLPFNYRDINVYSVGTQYRYDNNWAFRTGFHYAQESTPSTGALTIIPSTPTTNVMGGVSYSFSSQDVVDFSMSYAFRKKLSNDSPPLTDKPIEISHAQVTASIAYTKSF